MARERLLCASGKSTGTASMLKLSQVAYNMCMVSASLSALAIVAHVYGYPLYGVVLKHKNVSSIEEYNIGDRLKYSRIKQSSKKDIEESRISVKY